MATKGGKHHEREHDRKAGPDRHPFKEHRARGGRMGKEPEIDGEPEIGGKPEKPEMPKVESGRKRGGRMGHKEHHEKDALPKRKHGGKVKGKHPGHRLDRRARGGRMTPQSPFSGADGPDLDYAKADIPSGAEGKGRDRD